MNNEFMVMDEEEPLYAPSAKHPRHTSTPPTTSQTAPPSTSKKLLVGIWNIKLMEIY